MQAAKLAQLWEMMEGLAAAGDADTASGVYLDRLVSLVNVERMPEAPTRVTCALWGEPGAVIPAGHLARAGASGRLFSLQEAAEIAPGRLLGARLKIARARAGLYSFSIDGRIVSHQAGEGETEAGIAAALAGGAQAPSVCMSPEGGWLEIRSADGVSPFALYCGDPDIETASLAAAGVYAAREAGPLFVGAGALGEIVSNVGGLERVVNYAAGITGRHAESDAALRAAKNSRQRQAAASEAALENEIATLPGVSYCRVYSNRSRQEHDSRPPNSYEAVVIGGSDAEIAAAVLEKGPAGIQPFGFTAVEARDMAGNLWEVGFTRARAVPVWARVEIARNPREALPADWVERVKNGAAEWGQGLGVGQPVLYQRLLGPAHAVPCVAWARVEIAAGGLAEPPPEAAWAAANIEISEREFASLDPSRVLVSEASP